MEDKEKNMFSVFLSLGSNLGDKEKNIKKACENIERQIGEIKISSSFFYSSPLDFISENDFVNTVCEVVTNIDIFSVFAITHSIEQEIGRVGKSVKGQYSDRIIDIDILMFDNMIIDTSQLTIPHPKFHKRAFVLYPFSEIAPNIIHPVLKKTIRELKEELGQKN